MIRQQRFAAAFSLAAALMVRLALADAYDPPAGYYSAATGSGATLKSQLTTIMSTDHIQRTYGDLRYSAAITDTDPNNPNNILLIYNRASVSSVWNNGVTWNREHIWPVSLQGGNDPDNSTTGHRADPHALRPCNPTINSNRGNKPFGYDDTTGTHGAVASGYYFPGDADKGDIARSLFYSATRWSSEGLTLTDSVPGSFQMGDLSSLIAWHFLDVPDTFERRRNHRVYSSADNPLYYTNNRNAYIDRPQYVWSVFVDQANDSGITIAGTTPNANGGSTRSVDLGRVFTGAAVPAAQTFTLNKAGNDGTYYEVTTSGAATSSIAGRFNAFATNQTGTRSITVGVNTNTAMAGSRSGAVTVDNLDVTSGGCGGIGCGANDANDTFNVSLTVLDHATPSFSIASTTSLLSFDFGTRTTASAVPTFDFSVFNRNMTPGFTANLDFDSVVGSGDTSALTTNAGNFSGSLQLVGGTGQALMAAMNTSAVGSFSATYTLNLSDENIAGAVDSSLMLTLTGEVLLAGDFNRDHFVDVADYLVWQKSYGQTVAAYALGDGDGDMSVDDDDLALWRQHFGDIAGGSGGVAPVGEVPEPELGLMLLTTAIASLAVSRRRWSA